MVPDKNSKMYSDFCFGSLLDDIIDGLALEKRREGSVSVFGHDAKTYPQTREH